MCQSPKNVFGIIHHGPNITQTSPTQPKPPPGVTALHLPWLFPNQDAYPHFHVVSQLRLDRLLPQNIPLINNTSRNYH